MAPACPLERLLATGVGRERARRGRRERRRVPPHRVALRPQCYAPEGCNKIFREQKPCGPTLLWLRPAPLPISLPSISVPDIALSCVCVPGGGPGIACGPLAGCGAGGGIPDDAGGFIAPAGTFVPDLVIQEVSGLVDLVRVLATGALVDRIGTLIQVRIGAVFVGECVGDLLLDVVQSHRGSNPQLVERSRAAALEGVPVSHPGGPRAR